MINYNIYLPLSFNVKRAYTAEAGKPFLYYCFNTATKQVIKANPLMNNMKNMNNMNFALIQKGKMFQGFKFCMCIRI